jgi:hypothetical protein
MFFLKYKKTAENQEKGNPIEKCKMNTQVLKHI